MSQGMKDISMKRRQLLALLALLPAGLGSTAHAHHGWSSFDLSRPLYLRGKAASVRWRNPHAELVLELPAPLQLPADLAARALPAQTAPVDGRALLANAALPNRKDRRWEVELAPLTRMAEWGVPQLAAGAELEVLGFTFAGEKGDAVLRAEYLFVAGRAYGLRSSPA